MRFVAQHDAKWQIAFEIGSSGLVALGVTVVSGGWVGEQLQLRAFSTVSPIQHSGWASRTKQRDIRGYSGHLRVRFKWIAAMGQNERAEGRVPT